MQFAHLKHFFCGLICSSFASLFYANPFFHLRFKFKRQNCCCSLSHTYPVIEHLPAAVLNFCCDAVDANRHRTQAHNIWVRVLIEILFTFHCHFRSYNCCYCFIFLAFICLHHPFRMCIKRILPGSCTIAAAYILESCYAMNVNDILTRLAKVCQKGEE